MKRFWMAVGIAAVLTAPVGADDSVPVNVETVGKKVSQVTARLRGRLLGCLVRDGMTMEEVERILGESHLDSGGLAGGFIFWRWDYCTHGLTVSFSNDDQESPLRVDGLTFLPLID